MQTPVGSEYVKNERRDYSLYIMQHRAIPALSDGLKAAARRVLWTARDGKKWKSASLAGATMPLHPHGAPDGAINTLAAPWGNNVQLFEHHGAFGTMLAPTSYGASRYTSVKLAKFTEDVVFADIDIIPMIPNYDDTLEEPKHFLPLIPIVALNPQEGIAIGFACDILPRDLRTILNDQVAYLEKGRKPKMSPPVFEPFKAVGAPVFGLDGKTIEKWLFKGTYTAVNTTTLIVTNLPYGLTHEKFYDRLMKMEDKGKITGFQDESKDTYKITVRVRRADIDTSNEEEVLKFLGLTTTMSENNTLLDFDGKRVLNLAYPDIIMTFSDWRLQWYVTRYERLLRLLREDIQKYRDIILAIDNDLSGRARDFKSRSEMKDFLSSIGVVNVDYIADFSVYRFTQEEKAKVQKKLEEALVKEAEYLHLLANEDARRKVFVSELKEVAKKYA